MVKKLRIAFVCSCFAAMLGMFASCSDAEDDKEDTTPKVGSITGKAVYENASSHNDILITLVPTDGLFSNDLYQLANISSSAVSRSVTSSDIKSTKTSADGSYSFNSVTPGTYTIYASSQNTSQGAVQTNVSVSADNTITASDLKLTATSTISGKITIDNKATGNGGILVFVSSTSFMAITGDDGSFVISNVPLADNYNIAIMKGDYYTVWETGKTLTSSGLSLGTKDIDSDNLSYGIVWQGESETAPENPKQYWAYHNTTDGNSYIYVGTAWAILASKGDKGEQGEAGTNGTNGENGKDGVSITWKGEFETAPADPELNWAYFNTTDGCAYIWNGESWDKLSQKGDKGDQGETGAAGVSITWKGNSETAPAEPELNWAYYNSTDGCSYIWNGTTWELLAKAGKDGLNGKDGANTACTLTVFGTAGVATAESSAEDLVTVVSGPTFSWGSNLAKIDGNDLTVEYRTGDAKVADAVLFSGTRISSPRGTLVSTMNGDYKYPYLSADEILGVLEFKVKTNKAVLLSSLYEKVYFNKTSNFKTIVNINDGNVSINSEKAENNFVESSPVINRVIEANKNLVVKIILQSTAELTSSDTADFQYNVVFEPIKLNFTTNMNGIIWKGEFVSENADELKKPSVNWAYYNTTDGCSYIYNGSAWTLLAKGGENAMGTVSFFNDAASLAGTSSATDLVTVKNATFAWGTDLAKIGDAGLEVNGPTEKERTDNATQETIKGAQFESQSGTISGTPTDGRYMIIESGKDIATLSFKVTAKKDITISSLAEKVYFDKSGNYKLVVKVGNDEVAETGSATPADASSSTKKVIDETIKVGTNLSAGTETTVTLILRATKDLKTNDPENKKYEVIFAPLSLNVVKQ